MFQTTVQTSISVLLLLCPTYQSRTPAPAVKERLFNQPGSPMLPLSCIFPWNLWADNIEPGLLLLTHTQHTHKYPNLRLHHLSCFIHAFRNHSLIISSDHLPGRYASGFSHYPWLPWPTYMSLCVCMCVCVKGRKKGDGAITVHPKLCPAAAKWQTGTQFNHQMHAQFKNNNNTIFTSSYSNILLQFLFIDLNGYLEFTFFWWKKNYFSS